MMANALTRLVGEKGKEMPIDRYVRLKNNIDQWYQEVHERGLTEEEIKVIEPYYLPASGCPTTQEKLMLLCMDKNIAGFSLADANKARKICAKKKMDQVASLKKEFLGKCARRGFGEYIWETAIEPQMSYSFAEPHALAYSYVGIQTLYLATNYPIVYWNTAVLISDAGGGEEEEEEFNDFDEPEQMNGQVDSYEEDDDCDGYPAEIIITKDGKKKKSKSTNFGKVATAIGRITSAGITIEPPDINNSSYTFAPDVKNNAILYGLSGITRIGEELVKTIIKNRPYSGIDDFLSKVKVNKPQMINLIKCGAFDGFDDRFEMMREYVESISDIKKRITLQNLTMLIDFNLIPTEYDLQIRVFNFNKYLKKMKSGSYYGLDAIAFNFYEKNFPIDSLEIDTSMQSGFKIKQTVWEAFYQSHMDKIRPYVQKNSAALLAAVNERLISETWNKYCPGSISKWEMDSISCYINEHELAEANPNGDVEFDLYKSLDEEPKINYIATIKGKSIPIYYINRIIGTVLDRNKSKKTVTLLTTDGVVNVKIYGEVFSIYDRQISERGVDGKKHVLEKSCFSRGNKIIVTGVRTGESDFLCKKYKSTPYHRVEIIEDIVDGNLITRARNEEG